MDFTFWATEYEKYKNAFDNIVYAFKRFQNTLQEQGFNYIQLEVFPFDEKVVSITFGEYKEKYEDYYAINFEDITPSLETIKFFIRIVSWKDVGNERILTLNYICDKINRSISSAESPYYYNLLVKCYDKLTDLLKEKGISYLPTIV
ncbi:hypothetical protein SJAV_01630 [Sulfurisphaera javensis]|uniref:Uncharacterized protein n=1 Tax=Sulfurisphaera javensis TaxID=2049879 RepID=A0AAT9GMV4_9CREN